MNNIFDKKHNSKFDDQALEQIKNLEEKSRNYKEKIEKLTEQSVNNVNNVLNKEHTKEETLSVLRKNIELMKKQKEIMKEMRNNLHEMGDIIGYFLFYEHIN